MTLSFGYWLLVYAAVAIIALIVLIARYRLNPFIVITLVSIALALVAAVGEFSTFKSGRQFASWVGLVPRQVGTGGKTQQLGISKRGDTYLRTLLIAGARAVIARSGKSDWIERLLQRRHYNVVVVALANKNARIVWAALTRGQAFDPDHVPVAPHERALSAAA